MRWGSGEAAGQSQVDYSCIRLLVSRVLLGWIVSLSSTVRLASQSSHFFVSSSLWWHNGGYQLISPGGHHWLSEKDAFHWGWWVTHSQQDWQIQETPLASGSWLTHMSLTSQVLLTTPDKAVASEAHGLGLLSIRTYLSKIGMFLSSMKLTISRMMKPLWPD